MIRLTRGEKIPEHEEFLRKLKMQKNLAVSDASIVIRGEKIADAWAIFPTLKEIMKAIIDVISLIEKKWDLEVLCMGRFNKMSFNCAFYPARGPFCEDRHIHCGVIKNILRTSSSLRTALDGLEKKLLQVEPRKQSIRWSLEYLEIGICNIGNQIYSLKTEHGLEIKDSVLRDTCYKECS